MNVNATSSNRRNNFVLSILSIGLIWAACTSEAVLVTITNSSSSYYLIRDESAGNAIVTNVTSREGVITVDLPDNHNFRLKPGQEGDQGSHYFKLVGGQITYDPAILPTAYFTNYGPTSLTIGSVALHIRMLSGANNTIFTGGGDSYFPSLAMTVGTDQIVNLVPTDGTGNGNFNFIGNWKNIFPYSFVQQTPVQLRPSGIQSMTGDGGSMGTIVPSSLVYTNFVEGGIGYGGFTFTVDRLDGAQPGDGSTWLFFTVPEPTVAMLCWSAVATAILVRRRRNSDRL